MKDIIANSKMDGNTMHVRALPHSDLSSLESANRWVVTELRGATPAGN